MHANRGRLFRGKVIPGDIMEAWGFINLVFGGGWPPNLLETMDLDEFCKWLDIATKRNEEQKKQTSRS